MKKFKFVNKWVVALVALFGVSLISAGVFAAATITLNSGNAVNLGAGAIAVNVCDQQATISTQQTYDSTDSRFELTTISLEGIDYTDCAGKTITMAFKDNTTTYSTTWAISSGYSAGTNLVWGGTAGTGQVGSTALTPINTAASQISTIAIAAQ
jgi:hypothetical protein